MQTRAAADGMEASEPLAAPLVTLRDAHMKRLSHRRSFPRARAPLDVVHMDVVTLRHLDLPAGIDGARLGMKCGFSFCGRLLPAETCVLLQGEGRGA
jgi:hypothetical protein